MTYYVIDSDGHTSWYIDEKDGDKDGPEQFETEKEAVARAREIAADNPGDIITVAKSYIEVVAPVGEIKVRQSGEKQ